MKKFYALFILLLTFNSLSYAQSMFHPGARWVFMSNNGMFPQSFHHKWEYTGDSISGADTIRKIRVTDKTWAFVPPNNMQVSVSNSYFKQTGDSLFWWNNTNWLLIADFSVQVGDTIPSPLQNFLDTYATGCTVADSSIYWATVTSVDTLILQGHPLRRYTMHYRSPQWTDTIDVDLTITERLFGTWWVQDYFAACIITDLVVPQFLCYADDSISTGACNDLTWFDELSVPVEKESAFILYPNPADQFVYLSIQDGSQLESYSLYNLAGQEVKTGVLIKSSVQSISIDDLSPGIYVLKIRTDQDTEAFSRLIKM